MRKRTVLVAAALLAAVLPAAAQETLHWTITLTGARSAAVEWREIAESLQYPIHDRTFEAEVRGELRRYRGIPLSHVVAMVDGPDARHPYVLDRELWTKGYDVTVTAGDGFSVTFNTADIASDAIVLAIYENGRPVSPRLAGDVSRGLWVRDIVEIELAVAVVDVSFPDPAFRLVVEVNGTEYAASIRELEASPYYREGPGSYTTSAGTTHTHTWGGAALADYLLSFLPIGEEDTVTFVASDGYEMSYNGAEVLSVSDGMWILAFKQNGEYLPLNPGYIRTVKIGPSVPDIAGHSSVRMISRIRLSGEPYRDFVLLMSGRKSVEVDRQTMQSGVNCHKRTVNYERRETKGVYTGIPLWRLLAYSDDPDHAPHHQDSSIRSYQDALAEKGYTVELIAADGFTLTLSSADLDKNDDVIVAMYRDGEVLRDPEWPLALVWDKDAKRVPDGIKPIRQIREIRLIFE